MVSAHALDSGSCLGQDTLLSSCLSPDVYIFTGELLGQPHRMLGVTFKNWSQAAAAMD